MSNEMFTQLPTVSSALLSDIICAVQGNVSVQETLAQVSTAMLPTVILSYAGNPNGNLAGTAYQFCWDSVDGQLYVCTTTGSMTSAVWTLCITLLMPVNGGTGAISPTAHSIPVAQGASAFDFKTLSNGQVLIGATGADPVPATLTAGTNITITNTSGVVTIAASGAGGFSWNHVTGVTQSMASDNGYVADNGSLVTLTLPSSSAFGDELAVVGKGAGGWLIAQGSGQTINLGSAATTPGVGGSLASTNQNDSIYFVATVANTTWTVVGAPQGNITVV